MRSRARLDLNDRLDLNHLELCAVLRQHGVSVRSTASMGHGFPDAVAGFRGHNYLIEIKDGSKNWSLTPDQEQFHAEWNGQIVIIDSIESALDWIGGFRR